MSPKNNEFDNFFTDQKHMMAEGRSRTNPEDIGYTEAGGNITRRGQARLVKNKVEDGFNSKKKDKRGDQKSRIIDDIYLEKDNTDENKENFNLEGKRFYKTDPFNKRNFNLERKLNPGRERLEMLIRQTKEENELLNRVRDSLIGETIEPRLRESYLSGETLESINQKIESREKDLDYLEEGLETLEEKEKIQAEIKSGAEGGNKVMSPEDFRGEGGLDDPFSLNTKKGPEAIKHKRRILDFQLASLKKSLSASEKAGDLKEVENIKIDIQKIQQELDSLGAVPEKQKIRHWPPEGFTQKPGMVHHFPGVKSPEVFRGGEEKLGFKDPLNLADRSEGVSVSQKSVGSIDHAAIIENDTEKFIEAVKNGRLDEASHYKDSLDYHRSELAKNEKVDLPQEEVSTPVSETKIETKDSPTKKYIQDLDYSKEEILALPVEDQNRIVEEQITRNAWFREEGAAAPTSEVLPTAESSKKEKNFVWKETNVGADGSYHHKEEIVDLEELKARLENRAGKGNPVGNLKEQIENKENLVGTLEGVESAKDLVEESRKDLENLKNQKAKEDLKEKVAEEYKERETHLSKMGWTLEKYSTLTEQQKQIVFWQNLRPEDVLSDEVLSTFSEKVEGEEITVDSFIESVSNRIAQTDKSNLSEKEKEFYFVNKDKIDAEILKRKKEAVLPLPKEVHEYIKEEKRAVDQFVHEMFKEGNPIARQLTPEEAELYNKHKDTIQAAQEKKDEEKHINSLKGVSEGAKEFLGDQKLLIGLEKGYENFDKDQLIEVAKQRGLPSGGDKQKIIDRLIKDDIEKKITDFGFAENIVEDKLKEFNLSERDMVLLSPEFFSLSTEKQKYLLSKLEQKIYLDADLSSKIQNEEEIKKMGFWKKLGSSFVKGQRQVALRDKKIQEIKTTGIKDYRSDIKTLNDYLLDAPELTYKLKEKGRLVPHFEYVETTSSDKKFETPKVFFNVAASRLGEIPFEWSLKSATSSQREAYQKAYSSYTGAKESLMRAMLEEAKQKNPNINEEGEKTIRQNTLKEIAKADAQVKFGTFITQNPEMENLSANFFEKVLGAKANDFARGAMFAGAGFAAKWLGRSMAVTGVGLAVSGVVGGFMADRKVRLAYTEKELRQRYGTEVKDLFVKTPINFKNVHERLERLVGQLEKTTEEKSRQRILETIKTRIFVTEEMIRDGRINFGSQKEQTLNQYKLSEMMSNAAVTIEMNGGFSEQKTEEEKVFDRFKQFVKDDSRQISKDMERLAAVMKGASVAMLGFSVGAGIRYAQEQGYLGVAWEAISEKGSEGFKKAKEIISDFSADDTQASPLPKIPNVIENATPVETVMAGSRGVIGAIDDLQKNLEVKFGNNPPAQYKDLMAKTPDQLAREWGFYKPGEVNESAKIMKGEGFSIDSKGVVRFLGLNGTDEVYVPKGVKDIFVDESERNFFDAGKTGLARAEAPDLETESSSFESEPARRPEAVNEGYVVNKEVKPGTTSWFEKPVPTEFSASNVRGEWRFLKSPDGKITGINTSRTISDDVINFRKNPRNFMTVDLKNTKLLAQTDSFAVKTLTNNRDIIEKFLTEKNILNAPNSNLTSEETAFLKDSVSTLNKEIQIKTGGAFDGKYEEPSVFGKLEKPLTPKPERISYFDTDNTKPKINPSVTSVSEGSDFVPSKTPKPEVSPLEESVNKKPTDPLERIQKIRDERAEAERALSESKNTPKPVESVDKINNKVEIVSLSAGEKTYSFNTENIKGKIRFIFDEKGVVTNIQESNLTNIKGVDSARSILKDGWESKASEYSADTNTGMRKIESNAKHLIEYRAILEDGKFKEGTPEYKYLKDQITYITEKYKDVLK